MRADCWLILTYKVPPEPGKKRIAIWRKIKGLGAVYVQSGVCILPMTEDHRRRLKIVENDIADMGGESLLFETAKLERGQREKIIARINADRDEAYRELIERCEGFEGEIARERSAGKLTYAELEENDEDLKKLRIWFEKIRKLDFYGAPLGPDAEARMKQCGVLLDEFAQQVFDAQSENRGSDPGAEIASRKPRKEAKRDRG